MFKLFNWSLIKRQTSGTSNETSDNEWYNEWQQTTPRGTTSDNDWQRVMRVASANSSFFRIREESTTKHPKENSSNLKEDLEEKRDIELRAEGSP